MANQLYAYNLSSFGTAPRAAPDPAPDPAPPLPSSLSSIFSSSRSVSDIVSTRYRISETLASNLASKYSTVTDPSASMYLNQTDVLRFASSQNTSRTAHYVPQSSWHAADVEPSLDSVSGMKRSSDVLYETILGTRDTVGPSQAWYSTNSLAKRNRFESTSNIPLYPQRPGEKDCAHYMLTRSCGFGNSCKFDHPIWVPEGGIPDWKEVPQIATDESLPERPGEPDCPYFLKTQRCKFGLRCKFNHPKDQLASTDASENTDIAALPERPSEPPCAFYMKTGKCKFGVICKFHHPKELLVQSAEQENGNGGWAETLGVKLEGASGDLKLFKSPVRFTAALSYNSKGLPIRPEEVDCPFYIKTGSCKYGVICRYNHPDKIAIFQPSASLVHPFVSPASANLNTGTVNSIYQNTDLRFVQQVVGVGTSSTMYPQRPGQSECDYYMKTGVCKFVERCKFHHPLDRSAPNTKNVAQQNVKLTLAGLPRREGATMCPYYLKTGTCKYGVTCKFDHPPPGEVMAMALQGTSTADKSEGKEDEYTASSLKSFLRCD